MTISEFSKIIAALKTVYTSPGFVPNEQALDMWYRLVGKNNDYQAISVAAQMYMTTGKFPPTPADILECASKLKAESSKRGQQLQRRAVMGFTATERSLTNCPLRCKGQ